MKGRKRFSMLLAVLLLFVSIYSDILTATNGIKAEAATGNEIICLAIDNLPEDGVLRLEDMEYNFNPKILEKEDANKKATGLVYWEIKKDTNTAGVLSSRWGYVYPVFAGEFEIRAVAFRSRSGLNKWLEARKANGGVEDPAAGAKYVTAYSDWAKITVTSETEGMAVARTQYQLNQALGRRDIQNIVVRTQKERSFEIPNRKYLLKSLTIDAPNADVSNWGRFAQINIEQIKESTFHENAFGNKLHITAPNASIVVEQNASVGSIVFEPTGEDAKINIVGRGGEINKVSIAKPGKITLAGETAGAVPIVVEENAAGASIDAAIPLDAKINADIELNIGEEAAKTVISLLKAVETVITGSAKDVTLNVEKSAEGAVVKIESPLSVNVSANVSISFGKGAEGSDVTVSSNDVKVVVKNETESAVAVTDAEGNTVEVENNGEEPVTFEAVPVPTEAPAVTDTPAPTDAPVIFVPTAVPTQQPVQDGFVSWEDAGRTDHVMDWRDENLEMVMRKLTGILEGDIMLSDVWELEELDLTYKNVADVSALGELTNLQALWMAGNSFSDISPLAGLVNLERLSIINTNVTDISSLNRLKKMTDLWLPAGMTDWSVLSNMPDIWCVRFYGGEVSAEAMEVLGKLPKLEYLFITNSSVSNLEALKELKVIRSIGLSEDNIQDISWIKALTSLEYLDFSGNQITDISALGSLVNVKQIVMTNNQITDVGALENLVNLEKIDFTGNQITDVSVLEKLPKLETNLYGMPIGVDDHVMDWKDENLEAAMRQKTGIMEGDIMLHDIWTYTDLLLSNSNIHDISALGALTNLRMLMLWGNQITDIRELGELSGLQTLMLGGNQIADISALGKLTNLAVLQLEQNHITDISVLSGMTSLFTLSLAGQTVVSGSAVDANLSDLSALSGLTKLKRLDLSDNPAIDNDSLSALVNLVKLEYLDLSGTSVTDASVLAGLGIEDLILPQQTAGEKEENDGDNTVTDTEQSEAAVMIE